MHLSLTADWLVPLGAGVVILAALIVLWFSLRRRPQEGASTDGAVLPPEPAEEPVPVAEPPPGPERPQPPSFAEVPAHWSGGMRPTVASQAVAPALQPQPVPVETSQMAPAPLGPPSGPVPVAPWTRMGDVEAAPTPAVARPRDDGSGSSRTVAAAVAQAFAARATADRAGAEQRRPEHEAPEQQAPAQQVPEQQAPAQQAPAQQAPEQQHFEQVHTEEPTPESGPHVAEPSSELPRPAPAPTGPAPDVRDRLLAVLLHDPALAVDATMQLDACRAQLDRLAHAVRHEQEVLREVLWKLAGTGLRTDQLARLAGMPVEELQVLLAPVSPR